MLFVLGPHRSGTSIITLALKTLGFELGGPLIAANSGNETGYWEHQKALALNNTILTCANRAWNDPRSFDIRELAVTQQYPGLVDQAANIISSIGSAGTQRALKDPRLCLTLPVWLEACQRVSEDAHVIIVFRSPIECGQSLVRRDRANLQDAVLLWARYLAGAVQFSHNVPAALLGYDDFLVEPEGSMHRALAELKITAPQGSASLQELIRSGARDPHASAGNIPPALEKITASLVDAANGGLEQLGPAANEAQRRLDEAQSMYGNIIDTHFSRRYHQLRTREMMKPQIELLQTRAELAEARLRALRAEKELKDLERISGEK